MSADVEYFSNINLLNVFHSTFLISMLWWLSVFCIVGEVEEEVETADELALTSRRIYLVDSGLVFNSPFPPLLRPERKVDVFLSFDFSVRKRDVEFPFEVSTNFKTWSGDPLKRRLLR